MRPHQILPVDVALSKLKLHRNGNYTFTACSSANMAGVGEKGHYQSCYTKVLLDRLFKNPDTASYSVSAHPPLPKANEKGGLCFIFQPFSFSTQWAKSVWWTTPQYGQPQTDRRG